MYTGAQEEIEGVVGRKDGRRDNRNKGRGDSCFGESWFSKGPERSHCQAVEEQQGGSEWVFEDQNNQRDSLDLLVFWEPAFWS